MSKKRQKQPAQKAQKPDAQKVIGSFVRNLEKLGAKAKAKN